MSKRKNKILTLEDKIEKILNESFDVNFGPDGGEKYFDTHSAVKDLAEFFRREGRNKPMNKSLKKVKLFETENISDKLWDEVKHIFEDNEDTTSYRVGNGLGNFDKYLIELGCKPNEKIIVERGSW